MTDQTHRFDFSDLPCSVVVEIVTAPWRCGELIVRGHAYEPNRDDDDEPSIRRRPPDTGTRRIP